jgi:hypothetical protein
VGPDPVLATYRSWKKQAERQQPLCEIGFRRLHHLVAPRLMLPIAKSTAPSAAGVSVPGSGRALGLAASLTLSKKASVNTGLASVTTSSTLSVCPAKGVAATADIAEGIGAARVIRKRQIAPETEKITASKQLDCVIEIRSEGPSSDVHGKCVSCVITQSRCQQVVQRD